MIQVDLPMPEACDVCPFNYDFCWCKAFGDYDNWEKYSDDWNENVCERTTRPEYCPLKEQEAVEPYQHDAVWLCGNCEKEVVGWDDDIDGKEYRYPFCRQCGQAVKWE